MNACTTSALLDHPTKSNDYSFTSRQSVNPEKCFFVVLIPPQKTIKSKYNIIKEQLGNKKLQSVTIFTMKRKIK